MNPASAGCSRSMSYRRQRWRRALSPTIILCGALLVVTSISHSLAAAPITQSGLNTQVSPPIILPSGQTEYNITGGTRPGGGVNLFHSFGDFNVPTNNIANFLNSGSVTPPAIRWRWTVDLQHSGPRRRGQSVRIFGMIQTNGPGGFPTANLFLMNPSAFCSAPMPP